MRSFGLNQIVGQHCIEKIIAECDPNLFKQNHGRLKILSCDSDFIIAKHRQERLQNCFCIMAIFYRNIRCLTCSP